MNKFKRIISVITVSLLLQTNILADNMGQSSFKAEVSDNNATIVEADLNGSIDNSDLMVEVHQNNSIVYTGRLGGYDGGKWNYIDFTQINILFIWDITTDKVVSISPCTPISQNANISTVNNVMPISNDLSVVSQIRLNGVSVGENGLRIIDNANLDCNFSISNTSAETKNAKVVLATYTETGTLYNVKTADVTVLGNNTTNTAVIYQFDTEHEHNGSLMFWDSFSEMTPIRTKIDFSQTSGVNAYYYDADNKLLQIDKNNGKSIYYTYDKMGNLLSKTTETGGENNE